MSQHDAEFLNVAAMGISHILYSAMGGVGRLFINGAEIAVDAGEIGSPFVNSSTWKPDTELLLFNDPNANTAPQIGSIYLAAIYSDVADPWTLASSNFDAKLPNSVPVSEDRALSISEDGFTSSTLTAAQNDPIQFESDVAIASLPCITLNATDQDETPGFPTLTPPTSPAGIQITSFNSSKLTLYRGNGGGVSTATVINAGDTIPTREVCVRPAKDQFGAAFATFQYAGVDDVTSELGSPSTVTVNVDPVNDPPVPVTGASINVFSRRRTRVDFAAFGTDVDGPRIEDVRLTSEPNGVVVYTSDTGTDQLAVNVAANRSDVYLLYDLDGSQPDALGVVATFTIDYELSDGFLFGRAGTLTVTVFTAITAVPSVGVQVFEEGANPSVCATSTSGTCNYVFLKAADDADVQRTMRVRIQSLPASGQLRHVASNTIITSAPTELAEDLLPGAFATGIAVEYIGSANFFSLPATTFTEPWMPDAVLNASDLASPADTFTFTVETKDTGVQSLAGTQSVDVRNVNKIGTFSFPNGSLSVKPSGTTSFTDPADTELTITGVVFDDAGDRDADLVRVTIDCDVAAQVKVNPTYLSGVTFSQTPCGQTSWLCEGDGQFRRTQAFVGLPSQVALALNGLVVRGTPLFQDADATCKITIFDGDSDDIPFKCFNQDGGGSNNYVAVASSSPRLSVLGGCKELSETFTVRIEPDPAVAGTLSTSSGGFTMPWQLWIGIVALFVILCCCCGVACIRKTAGGAKSKVDAKFFAAAANPPPPADGRGYDDFHMHPPPAQEAEVYDDPEAYAGGGDYGEGDYDDGAYDAEGGYDGEDYGDKAGGSPSRPTGNPHPIYYGGEEGDGAAGEDSKAAYYKEAEDLPPGWTLQYDEEYEREYYYNEQTDESRWEPPEWPDDAEEQ